MYHQESNMEHTTINADVGTWTKLRRILRRELSPEWIGFNGVNPKRFATPQINLPFQPVSWIIWRFFLAFYVNLWLALTLWKWGTKPYYPLGADTKAKWLFYLSNWMYAGLCLYFLVHAISTLVYHMSTAYKENSTDTFKEQQQIDKSTECEENNPCKSFITPWYFKLTWLIQNVVFTLIFFTTFMRWYDTGAPSQYATSPTDVHVHIVGPVFVAIDIIVIATPYRLQHTIYPMFVGLVYALFTLLYFFAGGTNEHHVNKEVDGDTYIYLGKVDWGEYPKTTAVITVIFIFAGVPVIHTCVYLLFKLKELCVEWYYHCKG